MNTKREPKAQIRSQTGAPHASVFVLFASLLISATPSAHAILAGGETALPKDSPANRLDLQGAASPFNAIGALAISSGGFSYYGSGTAISPNWVLTAGHNLDLNDNGSPYAGLNISLHLPGFGVFAASGFYTAPGFTGFGNPSIQRDLGLLFFPTPLPSGISFPSLHGNLQTGSQVTLAGFGRSGYGDYGYTTFANLTDRRAGQNVIDSFQPDDLGGGFPAIFRYDFDSADTTGLPGGSLGNNLETLIGPGDSGGPLLLDNGSGYSLVGVNTFIEGYGGRFGDIGGGIVLEPYLDWINQVTGLPVPEPSASALVLLGGAFIFLRRSARAVLLIPAKAFRQTGQFGFGAIWFPDDAPVFQDAQNHAVQRAAQGLHPVARVPISGLGKHFNDLYHCFTVKYACDIMSDCRTNLTFAARDEIAKQYK